MVALNTREVTSLDPERDVPLAKKDRLDDIQLRDDYSDRPEARLAGFGPLVLIDENRFCIKNRSPLGAKMTRRSIAT